MTDDVKRYRFEMRITREQAELLDEASRITGLSKAEVLTTLLESEMASDQAPPFWWLEDFE